MKGTAARLPAGRDWTSWYARKAV